MNLGTGVNDISPTNANYPINATVVVDCVVASQYVFATSNDACLGMSGAATLTCTGVNMWSPYNGVQCNPGCPRLVMTLRRSQYPRCLDVVMLQLIHKWLLPASIQICSLWIRLTVTVQLVEIPLLLIAWQQQIGDLPTAIFNALVWKYFIEMNYYAFVSIWYGVCIKIQNKQFPGKTMFIILI